MWCRNAPWAGATARLGDSHPYDGCVCMPSCTWLNSLKVGLDDQFLLLFKFMLLFHDLGTKKPQGVRCRTPSRRSFLFLCPLNPVHREQELEAAALPLDRTSCRAPDLMEGALAAPSGFRQA